MTLTYASALAQLKQHAVDAGAAVTPAILDVAIGPPVPNPNGRTVRLFYDAEVEPAKMGAGSSLNSRLVGERIALIFFIPVSSLSLQEIEAVEDELYDFKHELRTRVLADSKLGGMSTDLEMGLCQADYGVIGNIRYRTLATDFVTDYAEYTIAP